MSSYDFCVSVFPNSFRIYVSHRVLCSYIRPRCILHRVVCRRTARFASCYVFIRFLCECLFVFISYSCFASCRMNTRPVCTATPCNTLQHPATHCNTHCHTLQHMFRIVSYEHTTCMHCNTLQHSATHCNTLLRTPTYTATHVSHRLVCSYDSYEHEKTRYTEKDT